jgi:hypothetical protein
MLAQHKLGQKRHNKKLKRKNKKYTGPKYSTLEKMLLIAPLLERAGIQMFGKDESVSQITGDSSTMFTE